MNIELPERPNPLRNGRIVGENVLPSDYLGQPASLGDVWAGRTKVKRGDKDFVMSRSELKDFSGCPARWREGYHDEESTTSQEWGSLLDCLLLTPEQFENRYAIKPEKCLDQKGKEVKFSLRCKSAEEWAAAQIGKTLTDTKEMARANEAKARLLEDAKIREMLTEARRQVFVTAEYPDRETGLVVPVKVLIDAVPTISTYCRCLADLKTCASAAPGAWEKECFNRWYHVQAALVLDTYEAATGEGRTDFLHILQENFEPFQVGRRLFSTEFITLGRLTYETTLRRYAACLKTNQWPGYDDDWTLIQPAKWMIENL